MLQNALSKYLSAKFDENQMRKEKDGQGLVVTISRQTGCDGLPIIEKLVKKLNQKKHPFGKPVKWKYLSKEILVKSANKLRIHPDKIERLLNEQEKNIFEEILLSLSDKNYPSDIKIKKTIKEVIETAAKEGNVVILGRGGVALTRHLKKSLHIWFSAPLEWRIKKEAIEFNTTEQSAEKHIKISDKQRSDLRNYYFGKVKDDTVFDVVYNVSTMKSSEIVNSIYQLIVSRQG
ncbi:MAG: cytidylate kinase-like family protein [Bacteroidetes bacterium]|nr:cytidylate kinase-like family protein [Bacteroidota bacterium]